MGPKGLTVSMLPVVFIAVVLCAASVQGSVITNPGFESEENGEMPLGMWTDNPYFRMPEDWDWAIYGFMNGHGIHTGHSSGWSSEGDWSLYMFAAEDTQNPQDHFAGDFLEFHQSVDLTNIVAISFDVWLDSATHTNSYISIDSDKLWTSSEVGIYYGQIIDTSMFSGLCELALGVEVFEDFGPEADGNTYFDNLIAIPEPSTFLLVCLGTLGLAAKRKPG